MQRNYQRSMEQLRQHATMFWPRTLQEQADILSSIPRLLETQDEFIAFLTISAPLHDIFDFVNKSKLTGNLFLKHLTLLADFAGEQLQRVNENFELLFPDGKLDYLWNDKKYSYTFEKLPAHNLTTDKLKISSEMLSDDHRLEGILLDIAMILLFGSSCTNERTSGVLYRCEIGKYLGQAQKLKNFVSQRYIWVSRVTMGSRANDLGRLAEEVVMQHLQKGLLIEGVSIKNSGRLPGISHTASGRNQRTSFDIVVAKDNRFVAIEIAFQETTNSTLERKAGQVRDRYNQINNAGYKIVYVIDGAGYFKRSNALRTICDHSHCTVAFSPSELDILVDFIQDYLK